MNRFWVVLLLACLPLLGEDGRTNKVYQTEFDNVLPQVADGGGWATRIWLVNMDDQDGLANLWFYKNDGSAWNINLQGQTQASNRWRVTVPAGGSLFLQTSKLDPTTTQGWAYMEVVNQTWLSGMASFIEDYVNPQTGKQVYAEGVVPFAPENDVKLFIPFDNRNNYVTALALVNSYLPDAQVNRTATVRVRFRDPDGILIREHTFSLGPLEHVAFGTTVEYPETQGRNGVVEIVETSGNAGLSALGLLFSPRNTYTSIHSLSIDCHYYNDPACPI